MGQKIHPLGFRLGITQEHRSKWFAKAKNYPRLILEDKKIRDSLFQKYPYASIVDIKIFRKQTELDQNKEGVDLIEVIIYAARPSQILKISQNPGTKFTIYDLRDDLENLCQPERLKQKLPPLSVTVTLLPIREPYSYASVIADDLIQLLESRKSFRFALKNTLEKVPKKHLSGIKIAISGRLNGAEMARSEWVRKGRVPLQTLRANIDYSAKTAKTIHGILGIKVWTFKMRKTL